VTVPTRPTSVARRFLCTAIKCQFCKAVVPHQILISNIVSLHLRQSHKVVLPSRCTGPVWIFKAITHGYDSHTDKRRACNIVSNVSPLFGILLFLDYFQKFISLWYCRLGTEESHSLFHCRSYSFVSFKYLIF